MTTNSGDGPLFEPMSVGSLTLKNRFVMGPMAALAADAGGRPSAQTEAFLAARARGGVGLIVVGGTSGTARAYVEAPFKGLLRADEAAFVPDFARVAASVHAHDVPIIVQVTPGFGRMASPGAERPIIAASPVNVVIPKGEQMPFETVKPMPKEATVAEIKDYEAQMVQSASNLERAGVDGIELAAHMSYFWASFLTPRTNRRTDEYGGSTANRARILVDVVRAIRAAVGPEFVIGLRMTSDEYLPGGQGAAEYAAVARIVAAEGVDYIAPTVGCYESMNDTTDPAASLLEGGDLAEFRKVLSIPLSVTGVYDQRRAEKAIASGAADLVMIARPLLADPDFVDKLRNGRAHEIVQCDFDLYCGRRLMLGMPVRCHVNPRMGREDAIARGASLHDTSLRRRAEDGFLRFTRTRAAAVLGGATASAQAMMRKAGTGL